MPNNWKTYKLGDIADLTMGISPVGKNVSNNIIGLPLLNGPTEFGYSSPIPKQFTSDPKKVSEVGDLLFCVRGSTTGKMNFSNQKYAIGRGIGAFKGINGYSTKYIKYLIDFYLDRLLSITTGSTFPNLSKKDLLEFNIISCNSETANEIASILSAIDDKIENNLAINKTLEEMAMALYKHWFVDFGPFQEGEFVESDLGRIPKGWEVKKIGEVIETLGGGTPSTTTKEYWEDGDILWYSPTDLTRENSLFSFDTAKKITALGLQKSSAKMFPANSLLMSSRATIGLLTINTREACTNQGFITMLPNDKLTIYQLYFWVKYNMDLIISKANGSTFKEISKSNFRDLEIVVPNSIDNYIEQSKDIFEQIKNNTSENQTLTQLRDTLLPKLISGEVRLKEFRE